MVELKEFVLSKSEKLHLKLYFGNPYPNTEEGVFERLKDTIQYEQLKEIVRMNPEWDNEEMARELSQRIRNKTYL